MSATTLTPNPDQPAPNLMFCCTEAGLTAATVAYLESKSFTSVNHVKALRDDDFVNLELPLGERVLLRALVSQLNGTTSRPEEGTKLFRHEYQGASYKNNDKIKSWVKGTFFITPSKIAFLPDNTKDNESTVTIRHEEVYHVEKSDSTVNIWPFKTNAINIFSQNVKHKIHLGSLRDGAYDKMSLFYESRRYVVLD